jgi:lipopolysaccharide/colanic/teichoic acid biosynthesis glycosyltransferase
LIKPEERVAKRLIDIVLALFGIVLTSPVMLLTAIWIKLDSRGPVFFLQERVGEGGRIFNVFKFRTMVEGSEKTGTDLVKGDPRITKAGLFLRRWCVDELPQLFNVLRGEMSCIGPRPTLKYQVDQYTDFERRRLEVKPGMTGLATVKGRNLLSWPERIKWDVWYIDNYSLWLDLQIVFSTFRLLTKSEGVYAESTDVFKIRAESDSKENSSTRR